MQYEALSYTWGEPRFCQSISWSRVRPHSITQSLYDALQRLRSESETRHLWVDQLCINQQDAQERSQQVSSTLLIYQKATSVLVWRGEPNEHTSVAFDPVSHMVQDKFLNSTQYRETYAHLGEHVAAGLKDLFDRPRYRRVW